MKKPWLHETVITKRMLQAYINTAIETSLEGDTPLDQVPDISLAEETQVQMSEDLKQFIDLLKKEKVRWRTHMSQEQFASYFWLTRNGHGANYHDLGYTEITDKLVYWAKTFGSSDLYVGDDRKIYAL